MQQQILCVYCDAPFTEDMLEAYSSTYGCESGCETVCVNVDCANCGKNVYRKNELGYIDSEEDRKEITEEAWAEIKRNYDEKHSTNPST